MADGVKKCGKCGAVKPLDDGFHKDVNSKDGRQDHCKDCRCAFAREYRRAHPENVDAPIRAWRKAHPELVRHYGREWMRRNAEERNKIRRDKYASDEEFKAARRRSGEDWKKANAERKRQTDAEWARANKERLDAARKRWKAANLEAYKAKQKAWRDRCADAIREARRAWRKANPEKARAKSRKDLASRRNAPGSHTLREWLTLVERFDGRCVCCGKKPSKLTADHVIPVSRGGSDYIENIQPLCNSCNAGKAAWHATDYRDTPFTRAGKDALAA